MAAPGVGNTSVLVELGARAWPQALAPVPVMKAGGTGVSRRCLSPDQRVGVRPKRGRWPRPSPCPVSLPEEKQISRCPETL